MQSQFGAYGIHVAVLANSRGVVGRLARRQYAAIAEGISSVGMHVLGIHGEREPVREAHVSPYVGVGQTERAEAHLAVYVHFLAFAEIGFAGGEIYVTRCAELASRLKDIRFLTFVELDLLHVVQREASQIHLSVLSVAELHAVVIDGRVLATHRADVDGLDTTYAAVVLELYAREIAHRVGYAEGVESLQFLAFERLRHDDIFLQRAGGDGHLVHLAMTRVGGIGYSGILRMHLDRAHA